jgi:methyl-accepting chemotaxis protein
VTNSTALEQLGSDLKTWMSRTKGTIDLENDLEKITVRVAEFVATLLDDIGHVLEKFGKEVHDAEAEAKTLNDRVQWVQMIVSIVTIIFGALISWVLTKNITSGLSSATGHLQVIAHEGDVSIEIPGFFLARKDEVGDLARAVKGIQDHFQVIERLAGSLANYDYSVEAKILSEKDTMGINLEHMIKEIGDAVHEINISAKQVATGSDEVSTAAQSLSNGSQEMAASLEQITATMHEISGQTKTNAVSAGQARDLAQASSKVAVEGQTIMHELIGAMDRITENSNEIQRVIKVVDDIAFQTNLLALNAAVEAARAGQHGKGFAVVAEEVRNLASRSAKAARETAELIAKSSQEIQRGDEIAAHTSGVFDTIVEQIKQTTDLVAGIATASNEQAQGVEQVSIGLHQIDGVTQSNSASAEESASAASEMNSMAKNLQALVAKFRLRDKA